MAKKRRTKKEKIIAELKRELKKREVVGQPTVITKPSDDKKPLAEEKSEKRSVLPPEERKTDKEETLETSKNIQLKRNLKKTLVITSGVSALLMALWWIFEKGGWWLIEPVVQKITSMFK